MSAGRAGGLWGADGADRHAAVPCEPSQISSGSVPPLTAQRIRATLHGAVATPQGKLRRFLFETLVGSREERSHTMMIVFTEKILGSPLSWAPSASRGSALAIDLQASRQLWTGPSAG